MTYLGGGALQALPRGATKLPKGQHSRIITSKCLCKMLKVKFPIGKDGRVRWFAVNEDSGRIPYSGFPNSFSTEQEAWEDAEWAIRRKRGLNVRTPGGQALNCSDNTH